MILTIHVETEKTEQPLIYQGSDAVGACDFLAAIADAPTIIQCNLIAEVNEEARALARTAKGAESCMSLLSDIQAFLNEVAPEV